MENLAILLTCYNRKEKTVNCLKALKNSAGLINSKIYLVDDGSKDDTSEAVAQGFSDVEILKGDGSLFWSGGMRLAFSQAMRHEFRWYLWLNDDTLLFDDGVSRLLRAAEEIESLGKTDVIVVGAIQDPMTKEYTYGGVQSASRWHPGKFKMVLPSNEPVSCDTFHGNCVLISNKAALRVGNLDPIFIHAMADFDYGLRAKKKGIGIYLVPGFVGTCSRNNNTNTWTDTGAPFNIRWKHLLSIKGLPPKIWLKYCLRHGGVVGLTCFTFPYLRVIFESIFKFKKLRQ